MNAIETMPETTDRLAMTVKGLEPASALALREAFAPFLAQATEWTERTKSLVIKSVDDKAGMKLARESRLGLRAIRVEAEKARVRLKADALAYGKAVDAAYKLIAGAAEPLEAHLLELPTCTGPKGQDVVARVAKMVAWVEAQGRAL